MRLAELVLAAALTALLAAAAGALALDALRSDRRLRQAAEGAAARLDAVALLGGLAAARAPGVSAVVAADGVHLRVVRAEARRCGGSDSLPIVRLVHVVRQPVLGDSLLEPSDSGWRPRALTSLAAATCGDGGAGLRLAFDGGPIVSGDVPLLLAEWLVLSATSGGAGALAVRSPGTVIPQPAAGPFPLGVRLEAWRADGLPAAPGEAPARLTLRWPMPWGRERAHQIWLPLVGLLGHLGHPGHFRHPGGVEHGRTRRGIVLFAVMVAVALLAVVAVAAAGRAVAATRAFGLGRAEAQAAVAAAGFADSLVAAGDVQARCARGDVGPVPVLSPPSAELTADLDRLSAAACRLRVAVALRRPDGVPWVRQTASRTVRSPLP
jgi:hypothetical protein